MNIDIKIILDLYKDKVAELEHIAIVQKAEITLLKQKIEELEKEINEK